MIRCIAMFIGGFIIAFIKGWLLALVMVSPIVPLIIVVGVMFLFMSRQASQSHRAYSKAASVVEQTIGSIRTVRLFISLSLYLFSSFFKHEISLSVYRLHHSQVKSRLSRSITSRYTRHIDPVYMKDLRVA